MKELQAAGALLSVAAHDFNNILQGITTAVELSLVFNRSPRSAEYLEEANGFIRRGARLVRQILDWIALARSQFEVCDLGPLPARVVGELGHRAPTNVVLSTHVESEATLVRGSALELEHLLRNLLDNALEAVDDTGRVEISVRSKLAERIAPEGGSDRIVELSVCDNGPGMSEEARARCLEPFFTTRSSRGAKGLGLSIAQGIVKRHGGRLSIESAERGTRVTASIPGLTEQLEETPFEDEGAPG